MNYFDKIPSIEYDGHTVKNLLARAKLSDNVRNNRLAFYPYTLDSSVDRVDTVSNNYYDSPGYSWLIWMANDVVDPYYDMPLSEDDFFAHLAKKYGSVEKAMRTIKCYRANWYFHTEERITPSDYNALAPNFKKYYEPIVLTSDYTIHSYRRRQEDSTVSTNKVVAINLASSNGVFTVGEEVQLNSTNYGYCTFSNSSVVTIQHVTGAFAANATITGTTSNSTAVVANTATIAETMASTEAVYWSPVTYFEYEQEMNEMKKEIQLLDVRYKAQAETDLKKIMSAS